MVSRVSSLHMCPSNTLFVCWLGHPSMSMPTPARPLVLHMGAVIACQILRCPSPCKLHMYTTAHEHKLRHICPQMLVTIQLVVLVHRHTCPWAFHAGPGRISAVFCASVCSDGEMHFFSKPSQPMPQLRVAMQVAGVSHGDVVALHPVPLQVAGWQVPASGLPAQHWASLCYHSGNRHCQHLALAEAPGKHPGHWEHSQGAPRLHRGKSSLMLKG